MERFAIFVFYDSQGTVDDYVTYLLNELKLCVKDMAIVCNGALTEEGRARLLAFTDQIQVRENTGFDAMAYKLAMTRYIGWDRLSMYDEVILLNDTFYGPFYPFQEMFEAMRGRPVDFWGITGQEESLDYFSCNERRIPAYIQSYFCVFRKNVISDRRFREYWEQFDSTGWIFSDVVNRHEKVFTQKLCRMGFKWDTYVKARLFDSADPAKNFVQYYYIAYDLIKRFKCPVLKRKNFIMKHLTENPGESGADILRAFRYISRQTDYDVNMIWDNLLRLYNIGELKSVLDLNYPIPLYGNAAQGTGEKAAVIVSLNFEACLGLCGEYIACILPYVPVYAVCGAKGIEEKLKGMFSSGNLKTEVMRHRETLPGIFLRKASELAGRVSYLAFVHDLDIAGAADHPLYQYSLLRHMWENVARDAVFVSQAARLFEDNERLGFLSVPAPFFGKSFGSMGDTWQGRYAQIRDILKSLGAEANLSEDQECPSSLHAFWCRLDSVKKLLGRDGIWTGEYASPEIMAGVYPYVAQEAGYFTGTVCDAAGASLAGANIQAVLSRILKRAKAEYDFQTFDDYLDGDVVRYCRRYPDVWVYGAGENGLRAASLLKKNHINVCGFLISDGQPAGNEKYGYRIRRISEFAADPDRVGIVVSVASSRFRGEILRNLERKGYKEVYIL